MDDCIQSAVIRFLGHHQTVQMTSGQNHFWAALQNTHERGSFFLLCLVGFATIKAVRSILRSYCFRHPDQILSWYVFLSRQAGPSERSGHPTIMTTGH